jgi:predicted transposase YbfD/YdcC
LNNIKVICEKQTRTGENKYKTYIALEMNSKDLEEAINQKLSQDEKLKVDYDYEKFKETFNAEMQKLEAQQGGF